MTCEVKPIGVRIVQPYEVEPLEGGTRIHHAITVSGPLERGYSLLAGPYTKLLARETRALGGYVKRGASDDIEDPPLFVTMSGRSSMRMRA